MTNPNLIQNDRAASSLMFKAATVRIRALVRSLPNPELRLRAHAPAFLVLGNHKEMTDA